MRAKLWSMFWWLQFILAGAGLYLFWRYGGWQIAVAAFLLMWAHNTEWHQED